MQNLRNGWITREDGGVTLVEASSPPTLLLQDDSLQKYDT